MGGTGATIALALVMFFSREPGYRQISRISMPTQIFQINEPIMFGFPIVLNPVFMVPFVISAMSLTTVPLFSWTWVGFIGGDSCSMDNAADHWSFFGFRWRLACGTLGFGFHRPGDGDLLSFRKGCGKTANVIRGPPVAFEAYP